MDYRQIRIPPAIAETCSRVRVCKLGRQLVKSKPRINLYNQRSPKHGFSAL